MPNAITGTDDYHATMQQALTGGLRRMAGYVAQRGVFVDEPLGGFIQYTIPNYVYDTNFNRAIVWLRQWGWIAGGVVLHIVKGYNVGFRDIDLFCHSIDAYQELKSKWKVHIVEENERSCVCENVFFDEHVNQSNPLRAPINLVSPLPHQDWSHPARILQEFDLTPPAVCIIEPGLAYTPYKDDILNNKMNYIGNCRNPMKLLQRIMKYYQRGFNFSSTFWDDLIVDERARDIVYLAAEISNMNSQKNNMFAGLLQPQWAINDFENDYDYSQDSTGDEDYQDDWY